MYSDKEIYDAVESAHYCAKERADSPEWIIADALTAIAMILYNNIEKENNNLKSPSKN